MIVLAFESTTPTLIGRYPRRMARDLGSLKPIISANTNHKVQRNTPNLVSAAQSLIDPPCQP